MRLSRAAVALTVKVFFISWCGMLALRYCGLVEHPAVNLLTVALFFLFATPFFMLLLLIPSASIAKVALGDIPYRGNMDAFGRYYSLVLTLSVAYLALVLVDKVLIGGVLSVGVTEARYAAMAEGPRGSVLGALHYFIAGAPAILACLLLSRRAIGERTNIFGWCVVLIGFGCFFLSGGRNSFVVSSIFVLLYFVLERMKFYRAGDRKKISIPRWIKLCALLGGCYVLYLFVERAEIRGADMAGAMQSLGENYDVRIFTPSWLSGFPLQVYYCVAYLVFYLTHAPTYVAQYMEMDYSPVLMGGYGFSIIFRVFDILAGTQFLIDSFDRLLIVGVYLTLPGTIYVDFGWLGVAIGAILLASVTVFMVSIALSRRSGAGLMAASLCLTVVALSPVFSGLSVGNGFSILMLLPVLRFFGVRERKLRSVQN